MRALFVFVLVLCLQWAFLMPAFAYGEKKLMVKNGVLVIPEFIAFNAKALKLIKQTGSKNQITKASAYAGLGDVALNEFENHEMARTFYQRAIDNLKGRTSKKSKKIITQSHNGIQTSYLQQFHALKGLTPDVGTNFYSLPKNLNLSCWEKPYGKSTRKRVFGKDNYIIIADIINGFVKQNFGKGPGLYYKPKDLLFVVPNEINDGFHVSIRRGIYSTVYFEPNYHNFPYMSKLDKIIKYNSIENFLPEDLKEQLHDRVDRLFIEHAREGGTLEAYQLLITKSYGDAHLEEAYFKLVELSPSLESCKEYRLRYPSGKYSEEVDFAYSAIVNTVDSFSIYLERYPFGKYQDKARKGLEDAFFTYAKEENTVASFGRYLERFPDGDHVNRANKGIEEIHFLSAKKKGSLSALESFLQQFPSGEHAQMAQWEIAQIKDSLYDYQEFSKQYPNSRHSQEVSTHTSYFKAIQDPTAENLLTFFKNWDKKRIEKVSSTHLRELENLLIVKCSEAEMPEGYIILFDRTREEKYLNKAYSLINTKDQEYQVIKRLKNNFFYIAKSDDRTIRRQDQSSVFYWDILKVKPETRLKCASGAKKATYRVTFKFSITVRFQRTWRGITWFRPDGYDKIWEETYTDMVTFIVPPSRNNSPGLSNWETVKFSEFKEYSRSGIPLLDHEVTAEIVSQDLQNIVSIKML